MKVQDYVLAIVNGLLPRRWEIKFDAWHDRYELWIRDDRVYLLTSKDVDGILAEARAISSYDSGRRECRF